MKEFMAEVWSPVEGISIMEASNGVLRFNSTNHKDMQRVVKGNPRLLINTS